MKTAFLLFAILLMWSSAKAQSPWYFGNDLAVNLTSGTQDKNGVKVISGTLNPSVTAVSAAAGSLYQSSSGTVYVKQDNGLSTNWLPVGVAAPSSLSTINGQSGPAVTLATGTAGTNFAISAAANVITFDLPTASSTNTGKLSNTDWTTFNSKEPAIAATTSADYYRGDKTFQDLGTAVGSVSATFTNKTFDADATGNSISNIENADIKALAGIDATKIADGSVTNTEFQYVDATSSIQTQLNGKEPTITILPLSKGGTNKNMTASPGAVVYSDGDSLELTSTIGTAGQVLKSNGGGLPPSFSNSSIFAKAEDASSVTLEEIQVPNGLLTQTGTNKHLIELDNENLLLNPGFEHSTPNTSWTLSGTATYSAETSLPLMGKNSLKAVTSSQTISVIQDSTLYATQLAGGVNCEAIVRLQTNSTVAPVICARQAGVTSTTDCVTVSTDNSNREYSVPFVCRGTSNGVAITAASGTGTTLIDSVYVGPVKNLATSAAVGPWQTGACTSSHTLAVTTTCRYRVVGDSIDVEFVNSYSGPTTATGLTFTFPTGFTINTSKVSQTSNTRGTGVYTDASTGIAYQISAGLPSGLGSVVSALVYVDDVNTNPSYSKVVSLTNTVPVNAIASGDVVKLTVYGIPVNELNGNVTTYSQPCGANCVNEFSAAVSSTDVVSLENVEWINGNCTNATAGTATCNFTSGIFTAAPNCTVTSSLQEVEIASLTSTAITYVTKTSAGTATNTNAWLHCQKSTADYQASRSIVGSFKALDYKGAGASRLTGSQSIPFNTQTTLTYSDELWDDNSAMNATTGVYTIPQDGRYVINCSVFFDGTLSWTANDDIVLRVVASGSTIAGASDRRKIPVTGTAQYSATTSAIVNTTQGVTYTCDVVHDRNTSDTAAVVNTRMTVQRIPGQ